MQWLPEYAAPLKYGQMPPKTLPDGRWEKSFLYRSLTKLHIYCFLPILEMLLNATKKIEIKI